MHPTNLINLDPITSINPIRPFRPEV